MHTPRLFVPARLQPGPLVLTGDAARRLAAVMRVREGEAFLVFAGDGREWEARVTAAGRTVLRAEVTSLSRQEPASPMVLEVWCGLVRPARFDWAIEKCVEAGADVIRPLISEHAARGEGASDQRRERWQRIAVEAAEQSGRLHVPAIEAPAAFDALLGHAGRPSLVICDPDGADWEEAQPLVRREGRVAVLVGPEGGFSPAETARARAAGAVALRLGPHIMRTETAAVVAAAFLRSRT